MNLIRLKSNGANTLNKLKELYLDKMNYQINQIVEGQSCLNEQFMSMEMFDKRLKQINTLLGWIEENRLVDFALCKTDVEELIAEAEDKFPDYVLGLRGILVLLTNADAESDFSKKGLYDNGLFTNVIPYGLANRTYLFNVAKDIEDALKNYCREIKNCAEDFENVKEKITFVSDIGTLVINALKSRNPNILGDSYPAIKSLFDEIMYAYSETESDGWFESFNFVTEVFMKEYNIDRILVKRLSFTVSDLTNAENITDAIEEVASAITNLHDEWRDCEDEDDIEFFTEELFELKTVMNYLINLI